LGRRAGPFDVAARREFDALEVEHGERQRKE
jgi:hypothetical protein